jgi:NAD(P)H dehydrogenase (quinone)
MAWTMLRDAHYADAMIVMAGPQVMQTGQWVSNAGEGLEAMVWRDDCIAAAAAVLIGEGHEGQIYNITGPELQSFREVAAMMAEITRRPVEYVSTTDEQQYAMFDALGIPRRPVDEQWFVHRSCKPLDEIDFRSAEDAGPMSMFDDECAGICGV